MAPPTQQSVEMAKFGSRSECLDRRRKAPTKTEEIVRLSKAGMLSACGEGILVVRLVG
ncbi:hypothetical protein WN944_028081 [Citrus x changshan-huyou]|uniref:Uncharacterized protein n=1 Tax=Citrus x changshan-huyou TaxID=2935761 RepID=A0AAP0LJW0_9ROSI